MRTKRKQWATGGVLLASLLWAGAVGAQNLGTGTQGTSGSSQGTSATVNNAPTFDPVAAAAARLLGTYRVPGAPLVDPTGAYRVPVPDTSGGAGSATTSAATPSTTTTSATTSTTTTASSSP
jgi:hypothetical protein